MAARSEGPPLLAIAMLSAAALGYEILLMRLFSIIQWHHFAYMMISVALLATRGNVCRVFRRALVTRYVEVVVAAAAAFGMASVCGFLLAQQVAFNPLEMLWNPAEPLRLAAVYGLLFVPFFCAAIPICLTFTRFGEDSPRIYSYDIFGAGAGCLAILAALFAVAPADALTLVGGGHAASGVAAFRCGCAPNARPGAVGAAIALPVLLPPTDPAALGVWELSRRCR
jgi:hypothetical protein